MDEPMTMTQAFWILVLFFIEPLVTIWALDIMFPALAIPMNFSTWVATGVLCAVIKGRRA